MMAAVHNNNSNPLQCHEHVQLVANYRHGNTPTVRSPVTPRTLYGLRKLLLLFVYCVWDY